VSDPRRSILERRARFVAAALAAVGAGACTKDPDKAIRALDESDARTTTTTATTADATSRPIAPCLSPTMAAPCLSPPPPPPSVDAGSDARPRACLSIRRTGDAEP
jgi:hypothetical protein